MAELVEEPLPKGVKRIGPVKPAATTTEEEPLPKGVRRIGSVDPNKEPVQRQAPPPGVRLGAPDFERNKEYNRLNDIRQKLRLERQKELGIELKAFAKTRQDELAASPPPPEWKKQEITNERGEIVEVMKRSTASMQHDLAMKTYRKIAEMEPGEVQDFLDGFQSSGKRGVDLEGTLRLLPFVGAFLDYNEADLLNQAAMEGKPTPSAQALLTAKNTQLQMQSMVNHGRWGDVGELMSQMVPFALEFMVTRGAGGGASAELRGLASTMVKTSPKTAAVLKATAAASKSGLGSAVAQTAVNVPRVAATAEQRKTPELGGVVRNEEGELVSAPVTEEARAKAEGNLEATLKAFGSGVVENFTERFGGFADDLFMAAKARGLNLSKKALVKTLSNVGENGMTALQKKAREVGVDSFLGEVLLEEVPSQIGTALVTGDELNLDYDQLLNLGIAAGIPGGVVTASAVPRAIGYLFNKVPKKPVDKSGKPVTQTDKYEVTGEILIQKASTGKHTDMNGVDVTEYTTGLVNKRTGQPIIIHEINDGQSIMFQTPEGEFVGTSAQDVANQVQRAGLPQVTPQQVAQAEKVIGATGYNKESFKLALIDVFNYPKRQADIIATIADRMVQTIAKREGITPDQAYQKIKLAKGEITEKGEIIEAKKAAAPSKADTALADKLRMPVSKLVEAETDVKTGKYTNAPLQEKGGEAKGAYVPLGEGRGLLFAFTGADVTTALHELSHHYEKVGVMTEAEYKTIEEWSGHKAGTVEFSEAFARGFESFLKDGKVSSPEMKDAFSKFKKYLSDAIKAWIDTGRPLSKPMENIYRDMLGEPALEELKTKAKANADKVESPAKVSVQPAPSDGKKVDEGNAKSEKPAAKSKEKETAKGKKEVTQKVGEKASAVSSGTQKVVTERTAKLDEIAAAQAKKNAEYAAYQETFTDKDESTAFRLWVAKQKEAGKIKYYGSATSYTSDLFVKDKAAYDKLLADYRAKAGKKAAPTKAPAKAAAKNEPAKVEKKAAPAKTEKKEEKKAKAPKEVAAVHKAAKDAGVDINSKDFADISEELTGERHLDNMTPEQLQLVEAYVTEEMNEANKDVPEMEEAEEVEEEAPAPAKTKLATKAKAPAKTKPTGDQLQELPAVQRGAVKKKVGEKFKLVGVKKFGDKILPVVEMKRPDGGAAFVTHRGDVFHNVDDAVKKSLVEEKKARKKPAVKPVVPIAKEEAVAVVNGDTSVTQPAMQPAKATVPTKHIEKVKAEPKKETPKIPKRTVTQQPTEDVESTSVVVVEALKGLDFVPDTVADLTDLVASMDEEGRPLGAAKAFAIIHQMQTEGFIEIDGKKVTPLFQLSPSQQQASKDYITNAQQQVLDDIAKATAAYNPATNMKVAGVASFKDWVKGVEAGAKGDAATVIKAIGSLLNTTAADAKAIYDGIKGTTAPVLDGNAKGFLEAWSRGRGHALQQYGQAFTHLIKQVHNMKLIDTVNPINWTRIVSLPLSAMVSVVQTAKTLALGNLESEFIAPRMRALGNWYADKMREGVVHRNLFIRNISQAMQGFYRGLTYSTAGVEAQAKLRGGINEGNVLAQRLMEEMYRLVNGDGVKLARVHAVLDPEVYDGTTYAGITEASLGADEALLLQVLRDNMALLHDHSFARGYISEETYLKHKDAGGYFGREYEEIVNSQMFGDDLDAAFGAVRGDFSIYTKRKDFKDIKMTIEKDPVFIAAQRMATAVANQAVTDYADYIGDAAVSKVISYSEADFEKMKKAGHPMKGFTLLRGHTRVGGVYGALTNRYVPNYIAYDFKGFFLTSKLAQHTYNVIKEYDRMWIRQEIKKLHTVYNPAVILGNQASNYTFAFVNDVDLFNFNIMLSEAEKTISEKDAVYNTLLAAGVIGTDVTTTDLAPLRKRQQAVAKPSLVGSVVHTADKVTKAYSETDDKAKIAAYRVKTEVQGKSSEQAITEVLSGFQNYQSVGMFFDIGAKLPIIGNPFVKFLGDVQRIAISSIAYRPLTTAAYIGSIIGLQSLASSASGEDEERRAVREGRPYQPRIPFTNIPLTFKLPWGNEINLARYLSPFTLYDRGEATEGIWNTFTELMPVQPYVVNGPNKPGYWKFSDPVVGQWFSMFTDKDFRGMSIANPTKTADSHEQRLNQAEYFIRSFGFIPTTASDMYRIIMNGQDYYGRNRTEMERIISIFVRVEEFGDPEVRKVLMNRVIDLNYNVERIHDKANALYRAGDKNMVKIQSNTTLTDAQRERQTMAEYDRIQKSILELASEYIEANKKLTEAAEYSIEMAEKINATAKPTVSQP